MNIMYERLSDLPIKIDICEGLEPDKFTIIMKNLFNERSVDDLSEESEIPKPYCEKIKSNIHKITFLSELVSEKIIPIRIASMLYYYGFKIISKKKLNKFYV